MLTQYTESLAGLKQIDYILAEAKETLRKRHLFGRLITSRIWLSRLATCIEVLLLRHLFPHTE